LKGFTLLNLIIVIAIIGILMAIPSMLYRDYIIKAKITSLLTSIGSEKIRLVELIKKSKQVDYNHRIILDTDHIVDKSILIISPIIIDDKVYWGCHRIGLSNSQVPHFCRINDFISSQTNIGIEANCTISQGITYNEIANKFSVNVKINDEVIVLGNFDNIKEASASYLEYLNF
jgi:type IV pilus assembly protein PilA